jgi:single-strand DNA-binding protein
MAYDLNNVSLVGNLTRDPEIRHTNNGKSVVSISIAINEGENVSYFDCVGWEGIADVAQQFLSKGKKIGITGKLIQRRWQDQSGNKRSTVEILIKTLHMMGK